MVSGIGLGKFNPLDMKETAKSSKPSSFDSSSSQEVTPRSNNSSASQNKSLEKSREKSDKKDFNSKVESYSKEPQNSSKVDKSGKFTDKKIKEAQSEIQQSSEKNSQENLQNGSEIPQMAMLQGVQPLFINQQATAEVKSSDSVGLNLENVSGKVSEQTQPVLQFLKAMQENFGISPHQVMKALGEMPTETMLQSPQAAMTPLFEKLGIQPKQFTKAQILYTEMLTAMEKNPPEAFSGKLAVGAGTAGVGAAAAMKSSELPVQMMDKPVAGPKSTLDQLIEQKISRRALEPSNMKGALPQVQQPQVNMAQVFKMDPSQINPLATPVDMDSVALNKLQELDPNLRIEDIKINPNRVTEQFSSSAPILGAGAAVTALAAATKDQQKDMSEEQMKDQFAEQIGQMPTDKKLDGQFAMDKLGAPVAAGTLAGQPNQLSNENVEKLISGSQTLIKKGGGEMKIQLNPEGLGTIHVNIQVKDGQVGVQMMADNHEAKKLLETSMSDLKVGLADHKLNLNQMKVDVSEQASQNMNQNHDFKREEARDFLGQFRQFNEGFRQGASDTSGARAYKKAAQPTPDINPVESRRSESNKSGGLYLVA
ncbi:MAG: flagellar hook-length control protein FliK [Bdellovibrionota bacterium]